MSDQRDIISGAAGAIIVTLGLYRLRPRQKILQVAIWCGKRLLQRAQVAGPGVGWSLEAAGVPLAGMSHGVAGIAWALLELAAVTGDKHFRNTALEALAYERSLFSAKQQNWPDLRQGESPENSTREDDCYFVTGWCHGAPGIGLARLAILRHLDDARIRDEIEIAIQTTLNSGFSENHSLCHGDLGNLELLLKAHEVLPHLQLQESINHHAATVLASISQDGWKTGIIFGLETPGLMVGLAGIGYQLLRLAKSQRVPSVLLLEMPENQTLQGEGTG